MLQQAQQERPDLLRRRQEWFDGQLDLDPARLVFIDETFATTTMARTRGRAPRGERLRMSVPQGCPKAAPRLPQGHWKTTTFVAGLRRSGMVAPFVIDGPIDRSAFEAYVVRVLLPELRPGDTVIMDNLASHKGPRVAAMIEAAGARLLYLPPYSPDFNPIEQAFPLSRPSPSSKALLRKAGERTRDGLWNAIGRISEMFTPTECANHLAAAEYDADWTDWDLVSSQAQS